MTDPSRPTLRGNNLDVVRRRNLSLVLGRVHELGTVSRAQLTKETGLNRSTIAGLVSELVELGLATESEPAQADGVGRPSLVIGLSDRAVAITVHPELDAATICLVALGGRILHRQVHPTSGLLSGRDFVEVAAALIAALAPRLRDRTVVGIGLAVPGLVRAGDGFVTLAPHLEWRDVPVAEMLREATGYEVVAGNDASLGAIAESIRGAGRGVNDLVYLNGGASGIGGGIIAGGVLLAGASGYAGEIGHTLVNSAGAACHCGSSGCLETEVYRAPLLEALGLAPTRADLLEETLLARLAEPGHDQLHVLVDRQLGYLARALANVVNSFNPQLILLGGFLSSLHAAAPGRLDQLVKSMALAGPREGVVIERATLGPSIIELGAAEIAFRALIADPAGSGGAGETPNDQFEAATRLGSLR
jgi:predicted NBD/HSP70 family sugar kinase